MEVRLNGQNITRSVQWPVNITYEIGRRSLSSIHVYAESSPGDARAQFGDGGYIQFEDDTYLEFDQSYAFDGFLGEIVVDVPGQPFREYALENGATHYFPLDERDTANGIDLVSGLRSLSYQRGAVDYREWQGEQAAVPYGGAIECLNTGSGSYVCETPAIAEARSMAIGVWARLISNHARSVDVLRLSSGVSLRMDPDGLTLVSGAQTVSAALSWTPGEWRHLAIVRDAGALRATVDGATVATLANPPVQPSGVLRCGYMSTDFPALIGLDELSIGPPAHIDVERARYDRAFGGLVYQPLKRPVRGRSNQATFELPLVGFEYYLDKNYVPNTYAEAAEEQLRAVFAQILTDIGFAGYYSTDGIATDASLLRLVGNDDSASDVFERAASSVSCHMFVDPRREIQVASRNQVIPSDIVLDGSNIATATRQLFPRNHANSVIVRGNQAEGERTDSFVADGTTGTFPLSYTPTRISRIVRAGEDETGSPMWSIDTDAPSVTRDPIPAAGEGVAVSYGVKSTVRAVAERADLVARYGRIQRKIDIPTINSADEAKSEATRALNRFDNLDFRHMLETKRNALPRVIPAGIAPSVLLPKAGLTGARLLLERVELKAPGRNKISHTLTAKLGDAESLFADFWRRKQGLNLTPDPAAHHHYGRGFVRARVATSYHAWRGG